MKAAQYLRDSKEDGQRPIDRDESVLVQYADIHQRSCYMQQIAGPFSAPASGALS
jgi:hypothetical protein